MSRRKAVPSTHLIWLLLLILSATACIFPLCLAPLAFFFNPPPLSPHYHHLSFSPQAFCPLLRLYFGFLFAPSLSPSLFLSLLTSSSSFFFSLPLFTSLFSLSTVQCPAHEVRFDSTGVILSPGYPDNYPNLQMCSWLINVEKGYNITLHFELFQTEKEFDILEIFDGRQKS